MYLTEFIQLEPTGDKYILLAAVSIPAGEPADICAELERFNLQEHITGGNDGVYTTYAIGDSMQTEIKNGNLLVVNRNFSPQSGDIIIASINGTFTVKVYKPSKNVLKLVPKNEKYQPRIITGKDDFEVFGVVTFIVHRVKKF